MQLPAMGALWRDGCGRGDVSVVLCPSLFCNITDHRISSAQSLGAFGRGLVKKEVEGPREPSDEVQASFYAL